MQQKTRERGKGRPLDKRSDEYDPAVARYPGEQKRHDIGEIEESLVHLGQEIRNDECREQRQAERPPRVILGPTAQSER